MHTYICSFMYSYVYIYISVRIPFMYVYVYIYMSVRIRRCRSNENNKGWNCPLLTSKEDISYPLFSFMRISYILFWRRYIVSSVLFWRQKGQRIGCTYRRAIEDIWYPHMTLLTLKEDIWYPLSSFDVKRGYMISS